MKERPILFSGAMVRALLAGIKTQTRRIVKPVKFYRDLGCAVGRVGGAWKYGSPAALGLRERGDHWSVLLEGDVLQRMCTSEAYGWGAGAGCPYGQPGDRLWVRETFYAWGRWETRYSAKKGRDEWHFVDMTLECGRSYAYDTDEDTPMIVKRRSTVVPLWWRRPAIFMPRAASRITLEITSVRVERLWTTWESDADCIAEGIEEMPPHPCGTRRWRNYLPGHPQGWSPNLATPGNSFATLWRSINGDASWDANPWVWVVEFKRLP